MRSTTLENLKKRIESLRPSDSAALDDLNQNLKKRIESSDHGHLTAISLLRISKRELKAVELEESYGYSVFEESQKEN